MMAQLQDDVWNLDYSVAVSIRYHAAARTIWDRADHWNKVLILVSGMSMVVAVIKEIKEIEEFIGFLIGLLAILDIVFGFSERARQHDGLYRQFCRLAKDIVGTVNPTANDLATWRARRLEIETEEGEEWSWLNQACYRKEGKARGIEKEVIEKLLSS